MFTLPCVLTPGLYGRGWGGQVWSIQSGVCNYTLEGHEKGVNCVDYYPGGEKPYLVTGADDKYVLVLNMAWPTQTLSHKRRLTQTHTLPYRCTVARTCTPACAVPLSRTDTDTYVDGREVLMRAGRALAGW
jgi:WD40 repeat protein